MPIKPNPIPAMCISSIDGDYMQYLLKHEKVKAHLNLQAVTEKRVTHNVRCILPGTSLPEERVLFCGHHDTQDNKGSNDNTSGLGVLLELARVLSTNPCKRTIEFFAPGAEEILSMGSLEYCNRHKSDLMQIIAVLNLDMIGSGGDLHLITEGRWPDRIIHTPEWLYLFVDKVARELNYVTKFSVCDLGSSDDGRFNNAGVPALFFWTSLDEHYHSILDTPEVLSPNVMKIVGEIGLLSAWRLANR